MVPFHGGVVREAAVVITDSHPTQPGNGSPASRNQRPRRHLVLLVAGTLLAAAVIVLAGLAATYQPIAEGGQWGVGYPGMPSGTGIRTVNNFLNVSNGDIYIPPQRGVFT